MARAKSIQYNLFNNEHDVISTTTNHVPVLFTGRF